MRSLFKCIVFLAIADLVNSAQSTRQQSSGMVRCYKEIGSSSSTCMGKYCYKMHTPDDTAADGIVKKGCMNAADAQTEVGKCTRRPLEEGGSELMCVCNEKNFCNFTSEKLPFSLFTALISIIYLWLA